MKAFLTTGLLFFTHLAWAYDVGYEVEVIIFEDTTGIYDRAEQWKQLDPAEQAAAEAKKSVPVSKKGKAKEDLPKIEMLPTSAYRLQGKVDALKTHQNYNVLLHTAWKQPGLDNDLAIPFKVNTLDKKVSTQQTEVVNQYPSYIDGELKLIMTRYLHFNINLVYHKPAPGYYGEASDESASDEPQTAAYNTYPIEFERRMRSREIHYIDYPLVGVIVLATPFKIETDEDRAPRKSYKTL